MKAFLIYTALRFGLFVVCYAVLGSIYITFVDASGALVWAPPFIAAVIVSSLLSLKYLAPQRERFAQAVEARATRASENFEKRRAGEDAD